MIAAIVVVSVLLVALFVGVAIAGNRVQTRMAAERAEVERRRSEQAGL